MGEEHWSRSLEENLKNLQDRSLQLSSNHKRAYLRNKMYSDFFKIPVILLSSVATFFNFGLQPYFSQQEIAIICSSITFITGLIGTLELYLQLNKQLEKDSEASKELFKASLRINNVLSMDREERHVDGAAFLQEMSAIFAKVIDGLDVMPDVDLLLNSYELENQNTQSLSLLKNTSTARDEYSEEDSVERVHVTPLRVAPMRFKQVNMCAAPESYSIPNHISIDMENESEGGEPDSPHPIV